MFAVSEAHWAVQCRVIHTMPVPAALCVQSWPVLWHLTTFFGDPVTPEKCTKSTHRRIRQISPTVDQAKKPAPARPCPWPWRRSPKAGGVRPVSALDLFRGFSLVPLESNPKKGTGPAKKRHSDSRNRLAWTLELACQIGSLPDNYEVTSLLEGGFRVQVVETKY